MTCAIPAQAKDKYYLYRTLISAPESKVKIARYVKISKKYHKTTKLHIWQNNYVSTFVS